jgi:hypothetical protein
LARSGQNESSPAGRREDDSGKSCFFSTATASAGRARSVFPGLMRRCRSARSARNRNRNQKVGEKPAMKNFAPPSKTPSSPFGVFLSKTGSDVGDREARADRQGREAINRGTAGTPVGGPSNTRSPRFAPGCTDSPVSEWTEGFLTRRWRGMDSNFQYAEAVKLVVAPFSCATRARSSRSWSSVVARCCGDPNAQRSTRWCAPRAGSATRVRRLPRPSIRRNS